MTMERVAFLIERTGERIECLLNPATFTITRQAGVRPQRTLSGVLSGTAETDSPLLATGGGTTELVLELLFDVSKQANAQPDDSVQSLTAPLWDLAENSDMARGFAAPPLIRFVWGKAWNIPAVVVSVAERFEQFTSAGIPRRSWVKMRLLRHSRPQAEDSRPAPLAGQLDVPDPADVPADALLVHELSGEAGRADDDGAGGGGDTERIDQLAERYYGDPSLWRLIAAFNEIDDPTRIPVGTRLKMPPLSRSGA